MTSQPLCSVIVPVYNVSDYLPQCIDSLVNLNNFNECQIILVDDGSTDCSGSICDSYASKYNNIIVIHQPNGGLPAARNAGMQIATGKFLFFVDSDDFVSPDFTEAPCKIFSEYPDVDCVQICLQFIDEDGAILPKVIGPRISGMHPDINAYSKHKGFTPHAPSWVYSREYLNKHDLQFDAGIRMAEDVDFTLRALITNPVIYTLSSPLYFYRQRHNSIMASGHTLSRNIFHLLIVEKLLPIFYHKTDAQLPLFFKKRFSNLIVIFLKNLAKSDYTDVDLALACEQFNKCILCIKRHPQSIVFRPAIYIASLSLPLYLTLRKHHLL